MGLKTINALRWVVFGFEVVHEWSSAKKALLSLHSSQTYRTWLAVAVGKFFGFLAHVPGVVLTPACLRGGVFLRCGIPVQKLRFMRF
jgi:hypothetical protein